MPAWLGPAITGAAGFLGTLATNASNAAQARRQMEFQERMSSSAHQRGRVDLEAAGYNPMLGVGGVGASSPAGAQARMENSVGRGITSAMQARQLEGQLKLLEAQTAKEWSAEALNYAHNTQVTNLTKPQVELLNIDIETKRKLVGLVAQVQSSEIARNLASALQARSGAGHADAQSILLRLQQQEFRNMSEAQKSFWMREIAPYLNSGKTAVGVAANLATPVVVGRGAQLLKQSMGKIGRMKSLETKGSAHYEQMIRNQAQNKRDMPSLYQD